MILYLLWRLGVAVTRRLPVRVSYAAASPGADIAWLLLPNKRANTIENMLHVTGRGASGRARALGRRSFQNYAKYVVDFMRHPTADSVDISRRVEFQEWDQLDAMMGSARGKIFVLMHFGNWDIGAAVLALRGYPVSIVAETQPQGRLNDALVAARTVRGVRLLPMERAAAGIVRAMRRHETLAILLDRPMGEGGVEVEFFGEAIRVPEGPARIALRTGAKVVTAAILRINPHEDRVRAIVDFSIETVSTGDAAQDVVGLTQQIMASHERIIREHPEQWYMFRRMWPPRDAAGQNVPLGV